MNLSQDITRKIQDKSYFEDALTWYSQKYILPITQRTQSLILSAVLLYGMTLLIYNVIVVSDKLEKKPFIIYSEDSGKYFPYLQKLNSEDYSPQEAVTKYLLSEYVVFRETYSPQTMNKNNFNILLKRIKSTSTKSVLNEFSSYMSKINPFSPYSRYRDHTRRFINIDEVKFLTEDLTNGKALIEFSATERTIEKGDNITKWLAEVHFRLPDIEVIAKTNSPLRFVVRYYKVKPSN